MTADATEAAERRAVSLRRFPLRVAARANEHYEGLFREFALLAGSPSPALGQVPAKVLALVDALGGGLPEQQTLEIERRELQASGAVEMDLTIRVDSAVAARSRSLDELLDEAEELCRSGRLLTLAAPPDVVAYRRWYLAEVSSQVDGGQPTPWPGGLD